MNPIKACVRRLALFVRQAGGFATTKDARASPRKIADAQIERDRVAGGGEGTGRRRGKGQTGRLLRVGEKGSEHKKAALPA